MGGWRSEGVRGRVSSRGLRSCKGRAWVEGLAHVEGRARGKVGDGGVVGGGSALRGGGRLSQLACGSQSDLWALRIRMSLMTSSFDTIMNGFPAVTIGWIS
jgi:hypothetical protein